MNQIEMNAMAVRRTAVARTAVAIPNGENTAKLYNAVTESDILIS